MKLYIYKSGRPTFETGFRNLDNDFPIQSSGVTQFGPWFIPPAWRQYSLPSAAAACVSSQLIQWASSEPCSPHFASSVAVGSALAPAPNSFRHCLLVDFNPNLHDRKVCTSACSLHRLVWSLCIWCTIKWRFIYSFTYGVNDNRTGIPFMFW